jgi:predicted ATPase
MAGNAHAAHEQVDNALKCADEHGERTWTAEIQRAKGEILLRETPAQTQQAEQLFLTAADFASRQSARSLELRAWLSLARLFHQSGKQTEFDKTMRLKLMPLSSRILKCDCPRYRDLRAAMVPQ